LRSLLLLLVHLALGNVDQLKKILAGLEGKQKPRRFLKLFASEEKIGGL
jgi:hypothetical protein